MHVRLGTADDALAIETIRVRSWRAAYRHVLPANELDAMAVDASRWRSRLERPPAGWSTFVVEHDGVVIGFASVGPSRDEHGIGELYAIYVEPDAWSTGAGRALIERSEDQLARQYREATLWVLERNERDSPVARTKPKSTGPSCYRKGDDAGGAATPRSGRECRRA
jgi:GNAT superfamily N-acetyltransferase